MKAFEISKTYQARSACDHNCIFSITIVSRTAKTVKTADGKTLRVGSFEGVEFVRPMGSYSMAPIIRAA
jgi:hypothetical protein